MGTHDNKISELVDIIKSWIPSRSQSANLSRDFWMPDQSCRVCYDCDSPFTVFNRRHHCRLCGRVFCAKCTPHFIPAPSFETKSGKEACEKIRVCSYCLKQWEQGIVPDDNGTCIPTPSLSSSPSATSLVSTKSICTYNSNSNTIGPHQQKQYKSSHVAPHSAEMDSATVEDANVASPRSMIPSGSGRDSSVNGFGFYINSGRSSDEEDDYSGSSDSESQHYLLPNDYYGTVDTDEIDRVYGPFQMHVDGDEIKSKTSSSSSPPPQNFNASDTDESKKLGQEADDRDNDNGYDDAESADIEPVDFENNGLLWLPPEPADEDDEREAVLFEDDDDDDDDDEGNKGEWGYLRPSNSFGSGEYRNKDKSSEEYRKAMKNVVEGHFKALVAQLLQVENLPVSDEDGKESWLDIITALSWDAASLLKPDTSQNGGMDPGGYVKVKCIACGRRSESMVIKGVVCKKNVAHRRMTSKIDKPRFLILGGALEYQRLTNQLSSFETLLHQEMDHLKMAVEKLSVHHPDVLLVEKSVSRHAQEYLLQKDISIVLNIKRPLLERIARCTGAQIVPSIDNLTSPKLGYCDMFHVEKFIEEHGSTGQRGKRTMKTLMFFEGCPKPFGCTILLKGASEDELKMVKHVVQYGVFAAYHLAMETSYLADEGASLPELPLKSPITVALPTKLSSIDRSISTIPGYTILSTEKSLSSEPIDKSQKKDLCPAGQLSSNTNSNPKMEGDSSICSSEGPCSQTMFSGTVSTFTELSGSSIPFNGSHDVVSEPFVNDALEVDSKLNTKEFDPLQTSNTTEQNHCLVISKANEHENDSSYADENAMLADHVDQNILASLNQERDKNEMESLKEEFPPSPSDHQSILVSLSTRCVWKGTVCERAHLFRIKYYGSFDKPLGRYLRDHLFEQNYRCRSCDMPSEAHIHCYTHRQGSLTISVKKLVESLTGEQEGKIWMWHRCLRCPRINGFPPATRRIVMSDAAWGLSFGKFLELSFSNHAAASRVASCGHSLHRDCLRFYGSGSMVACFRYASISVYSVYLPPQKVEFNYDYQDWIQNEGNEVRYRAEVLFTEVHRALDQISAKALGAGSHGNSPKVTNRRLCVAELEGILQKDKENFEECLNQMLKKEVKSGQPAIDILEINKLRRQILFHSYVWDLRLTNAAKLITNNLPDDLINIFDLHVASVPSKGLNSCNPKPDIHFDQGRKTNEISSLAIVPEEKCIDPGLNYEKEVEVPLPSKPSDLLKEGEIPPEADLSDTHDASGIGENNASSLMAQEAGHLLPDSALLESENVINSTTAFQDVGRPTHDQSGVQEACSPSSVVPKKDPDDMQNPRNFPPPFTSFYTSFNKSFSLNTSKLSENNPIYVTSFRELERQSGARLLLPVGTNDTVVPVYDDEPTSIIAYALVSSDYHMQMSESEKPKDHLQSSFSLLDSVNLFSLNSFEDVSFDMNRSLGSMDENSLSMSTSRGSLVSEPLLYSNDLHARVSFTDDGPLGKVKYMVTCYYAKRFEALRRTCCPSESDFIRSLSRCKKWGAQGGKSNVFFAKSLDDRFVIKQVTKTELESFIKFGSAYFKYLSESISTKSPTCLAKILGIYQVSSKQLKGGKESKMDVLVMENLLFRRNITRIYDLKGSSRSRYNADTSGSNKVLLDQNLIEAMPTSPIFVGNKAKRLLERAVWNDTSFLASIDVMDYSLLVGVDDEKHELVLGIIDFMRQYTWDKHLETWVKTSGILGGPKNASPTVISPQQYKKRFRKAMTAYFLMVPDQWSGIPPGS